MIWNGKVVEALRFGELLELVLALPNRYTARAFLQGYEQVNPAARANLGYLTGYCEPADAARLCAWFGVKHPFLGNSQQEQL